MAWNDQELTNWINDQLGPRVVALDNVHDQGERCHRAFLYALALFKNVDGLQVDRATELILQFVNNLHTPKWNEAELSQVVEDTKRWLDIKEPPRWLPADWFLNDDGTRGLSVLVNDEPWTEADLANWFASFSHIRVIDKWDEYERFNSTFWKAHKLFQHVDGITIERATQLLLEPLNMAHDHKWTRDELRHVVSLAYDYHVTGEFPAGYFERETEILRNDDFEMYELILPPVKRIFPKDRSTLSPNGNAIVQRFSSMRSRPIKWLWQDRMAIGKLTLLVGDPGLGKSFVTLDMAARVSRGENWPDGAQNELGSSVILSAEDDFEDTIRPRYDTAGGDPDRAIALKAIWIPTTDKDGAERPFSLERDIPALEAAIDEAEDCQLVIIDPLTAYCGNADSNNNTDVRGLLLPLADLAARAQVAIVAVSHLNKGQGSAIYRTMGSLAFVAAARAAFVVSKDRHDSQRRLFTPIKNNIGDDQTGLAYRIIDGRIAWEPDLIFQTADDALGEPGSGPKVNEDLENAKSWITDTIFKDRSTVPATEVEEWAKAEGIGTRHLKRAKKELGVKSKKQSDGTWHWTLEVHSPPAPYACDSCDSCATSDENSTTQTELEF